MLQTWGWQQKQERSSSVCASIVWAESPPAQLRRQALLHAQLSRSGYWEVPEQPGSSEPAAMGCHNSSVNGLTKVANPCAHNISSWESCSLAKSLGSADLSESRENEQVYQKGCEEAEPGSPVA